MRVSLKLLLVAAGFVLYVSQFCEAARAGQFIGPGGSGSITAMASGPAGSGIVYAAFEDVAVLRSSDGGATFETAAVASFSSQTVTCLAVHPTNSDIVLAGGYEGSRFIYPPKACIWKSVDGARTFEKVYWATWSVQEINEIAFSPHDPSIILAGADISRDFGPILRSENGGKNWTALPAATFGANVEFTGVSSILFDSATPGRALAGFTGRDNRYNRGLHETLDYGKTWNPLAVEPFSGPEGNPVFDLIQLPNQPNVMFAGTSVESGTFKTRPLWRSNDFGMSWSATTPELDSRSTTITGYYRLAYHPDYPSTIWAAQSPPISLLQPYFGSWPKDVALLRSDDLGVTWKIVPPNLTGNAYPADTLQGLIAQGTQFPRLLTGYTGLGLWKCEGDDDSLQPHDAGLPFAPVTSLATYPTGKVSASRAASSYGGTALVTGTPDLANNWDWTDSAGAPAGALAKSLLVNQQNPVQAMAVVDGVLYRSINAGESWQSIGVEAEAIGNGRPASSELFISTEGGLLRSSDFGATSETVGSGLGFAIPRHFSASSTSTRLAVAASPNAGPPSLGSGVFISNNAGTSFSKTNTGIPLKNNIKNLIWTGDDVFGIEAGALFHSADNGANWVPRTVCLPESPSTSTCTAPAIISDLQIGAVASDRCLWIHTDGKHLYRSLDDGVSWHAVDPFGAHANLWIGYGQQISSFTVSKTQPERLWAFGRYALAKSSDSGETWTTHSHTLNSSRGQLTVDDHNHQRLFVADESRLYRSMDGGSTWLKLTLPTELNRIKQIVLPESQPDWVVASDEREMWLSQDNGQTWTVTGPYLNWPMEDVVVASSDGDTMYAYDQSGDTLYTTDGGRSWQWWRDLPYNRYSLTGKGRLAVSGRDVNELLFSKADDTIYRSADAGQNWVEASEDLRNASVTCVAINPTNEDFIIAGTTGSGIYKSTDGGQSWRQTAQMIYQQSIRDLVFNPAKSSECFAATDWGLLYSSDACESWSQFTTDLEEAEIVEVDIVQENAGIFLYAATAHAGIWRTVLSSSISEVSDWQLY